MADDDDTTTDDPAPTGFLSHGQMIALGVLGVLAALTVALTVAARRQAQGPPAYELPDTDDWKVSLRHFAAATDYRFRGMEAGLEEVKAMLGIQPPPPPAPIDRTFMPSPEPVTMPAPNGTDVGDAPGPAATSLPADATD